MNSNTTGAMKKPIGNKLVEITIHPIPDRFQLLELVTQLNNIYKNNRDMEVITQYSTTTIRIIL